MVDQIRLDEAKHRASMLERAINNLLLKMKRSPGKPAEDIGEAVLKVANKMGVSLDDIKEYGLRDPSSTSGFGLVSGGSIEDTNKAVLHVAKAMGNSPEDIKEYGYKEPFSKSEKEFINEGEDLKSAVSHVAKANGKQSRGYKEIWLLRVFSEKTKALRAH